MIDEDSLAKTLAEKAQEVCAANSYKLIAEGESYQPDVNTMYIAEFVIYGDQNPMGIAFDVSDYMVGIYQININTPRTDLSAKYDGLEIAKKFKLAFKRGTKLTHDGQSLITLKADLSPMIPRETHNTHVLSIRFDVIN